LQQSLISRLDLRQFLVHGGSEECLRMGGLNSFGVLTAGDVRNRPSKIFGCNNPVYGDLHPLG
jgi:hypothetical protein